MQPPRCSLALAALVSLLLCACATNRSEVSLSGTGPSVAASAPSAGARPIVIRSVVDARAFEAAPRDPSIPSLGFGGSDKASAEVKARAIGRKRNTYGMALGDVLLEPGDTVERVVRNELVSALGEVGYAVVNAPSGPGVPSVDVRIDDFWSWITTGFFAITISTKITTQLDFGGGRKPLTVAVRNDESTLAATDSSWIDALRTALQRYHAAIVGRASELSQQTTPP